MNNEKPIVADGVEACAVFESTLANCPHVMRIALEHAKMQGITPTYVEVKVCGPYHAADDTDLDVDRTRRDAAMKRLNEIRNEGLKAQ